MTELRAVVRTIVRVQAEASEASTADFAARVRRLSPVELGVADLLAETAILGGKLIGQPLATGATPLGLFYDI